MCKKLVCLAYFVLMLGLIPANTANAQDPSLVGWWQLDDGSGSIAVDSSGNGNNGVLQGDSQWVPGKTGGALQLDGNGDYVDCGNASIFDITEQITLMAWVNTNDSGNGENNHWLGKGDHAYAIKHFFENQVEFFIYDGTWVSARYAVDETFNGEWRHVAGTFDGVDIKLYIDGALEATTAHVGAIETSGHSITIGENSEETGRFYEGLIDDLRIYNRALAAGEILTIVRGDFELSSSPSPEDGAVEVSRDVVLSWKAGAFADTHNVYFGTVFDDVNQADVDTPMGVLVSQSQSADSYGPEDLLDYGQTYYWRVDEVNAAPDNTIFKGDVWSFTVKPFAYPVQDVIATASSSEEEKGPENTVNGSGLDETGLLHSDVGVGNMWLSSTGGEQPTWIKYEFDKVYKLHEMWIWNSNESLEAVVGLGIKDVTIEYSVDDVNYTTLGTTYEFARAPGLPDYAHNTTVAFNGLGAKYIRLTANSNWGGLLNQYGLSEVRFFQIPVKASVPSPESGAVDAALDVTLSWEAGRGAVEHNVYLSEDMQAVVDGAAPVVTVSGASYGPLNLDLGTTYYWRVDEVNSAEDAGVWEGDIWEFTTQEFVVVDGFEDYNDYEPDRVFDTWTDGYEITSNGSTAGYSDPIFSAGEHFVEVGIVHGGEQSLPLFYDNIIASYSEVTANTEDLVIGRDWSKGSSENLLLWFYGAADNAVSEQLYVKIDGVKVLYDGDAVNLTRRRWNQWKIDLVSLGINLTNVSSFSIGLERTGGAGGSGLLIIDDISLYKAPPPEEDPNASLVENPSFEQPGTEKQTGFDNVPGWNTDGSVSDSGVETGWTPTDGEWTAYMNGLDPAIWQLTGYVIEAGDVFELKVDARITWQATTLRMTLYYDDNGTRVPAATSDVTLTGSMAEYSLSLSADDVPESVGRQIGIEFDNATDSAEGNWLGLDNVRLSVTNAEADAETVTDAN